ncbi:hypothetical protein OC861_000764 [Tilletia horrida]|nr:hypothetical protein OC861_000764 [Tilletia horrida]
MKFFPSTSLLAVAALLLSISPALANPHDAPTLAVRDEFSLHKRGKIHNVMSTISRKGQCGKDFCSTFLHVHPKTKTITVTKTVDGTKVPSSTLVKTTAITKTASPAVTRTNSQLSVVAVTPTVKETVVDTVAFTSTVATVTSLVTSTVTSVVSTYTSFVPPPIARNNKEHIPDWLKGHCDDTISKACSHFVSTKTCTKTAYVTTTKHCTKGLATVVKTNTVAVTPTTTVTVVRTSTSTAAAVTSTEKVTSSSLVPVTDTVTGTKVETVTAVATVTVTTQPVVVPTTVAGKLYIKGNKGTTGYLRNRDGRPISVTRDPSKAIRTFLSTSVYASGGSQLNLPMGGSLFVGASQETDEGMYSYTDLTPGSVQVAGIASVQENQSTVNAKIITQPGVSILLVADVEGYEAGYGPAETLTTHDLFIFSPRFMATPTASAVQNGITWGY